MSTAILNGAARNPSIRMNPFCYEQHDATGLAELVRSGQASAGEIVAAAIARIEAGNQLPGLRGISTTMPDQ